MELSFSEMFLVVIIAFLVLGPEELVKRSRQMGQWVGKLRSEARNFGIMAQESLLKKSEIEDVKKKFSEAQASLDRIHTTGSEPLEISIEKNLLKLSQDKNKTNNSGEGS
jgi:Sec-independent protein translocase protein TatA